MVTPEFAAAGGGVVELLRYLAPDETPDPDLTRAELSEHAGGSDSIPPGPRTSSAGSGRSGVVEQRYLHVMTVAHAMPPAQPAACGPARGVGPRRPGLFVAGDWVGPVGMLADAAVASAHEAAHQAVDQAVAVAP